MLKDNRGKKEDKFFEQTCFDIAWLMIGVLK
jgi:hypothetical protein